VTVVCGREHYQETARQLHDIGLLASENIIGEPLGRNTAPAILLATLMVLRKTAAPETVLFIFPADHVVKNIGRFQEKIKAAMQLAAKGHIVTFGIEPDFPETGYGYIEASHAVSGGARAINRFVEKPDRKTAESYLRAGNFFWNSGMFAFKSSVILDEYEQLAPDMLIQMKEILDRGLSLSGAAYQELPNISFDCAIMEHTLKGVVLPSDFGWSDIGSWKSLHAFLPKDSAGNVVRGDVIASRTQDSLVMGNSRLIVAHDLKNTVVVETPDAVFVSSMENSRDVKDVVASLKARARKEYQSHTKESYSWASLNHLDEKTAYDIATLRIHGKETYRDTIDGQSCWHIFLLSGNARLFHGDQESDITAGDSRRVFGPCRVALKNTEECSMSALRIQFKKGGSEKK
jgi:mannose-1-phosphate guanylyltransferase/mannose-6-phosphate isomerase